MNILSDAQFYCRYPRSSLPCQLRIYLWPCVGVESTNRHMGQAFPMNCFGFNALSLLQAQVLPYLCHLPVSSLCFETNSIFLSFFFWSHSIQDFCVLICQTLGHRQKFYQLSCPTSPTTLSVTYHVSWLDSSKFKKKKNPTLDKGLHTIQLVQEYDLIFSWKRIKGYFLESRFLLMT